MARAKQSFAELLLPRPGNTRRHAGAADANREQARRLRAEGVAVDVDGPR